MQIENKSSAANVSAFTLSSIEPTNADEWDAFNLRCKRGQPLQLSTWLRSFGSYGASPSILVAKDESGTIVGGIGFLKFGKWPVSWAVSPSGPVVDSGWEHLVPELVLAASKRTQEQKASIFQFRLPVAKDTTPWLLPVDNYTSKFATKTGTLTTIGAGGRQLFWIPFASVRDHDDASTDWENLLLKGFNESTRRNVRKSLKNNLVAEIAKNDDEVRDAFAIIERNGKEQGYSTRQWQEFGPILTEQVRKNQAVVLTVKHEDKILGTHYAMIAGGRYTYSMGGTVRTNPDLRVGHFAHWSAIKTAYQMGLDGYDFASGGTANVKRFKAGFRPELIDFEPPQYIVHSALGAMALGKVVPFLQKHKGTITKWIKR